MQLPKLIAEAGLPASARLVLGKRRGAPAEKLRRNLKERRPKRGVFGLFLAEEVGAAFAAPLTPAKSLSWPTDDASLRALALAGELLDHEHMPLFALDLDPLLAVDGESAGLAIYLAYLSWITGVAPRLPTFATGALSPDARHVLSVRAREQKARAALADLGEHQGLVLVPADSPLPAELQDARVHAVRSVDEARKLVFGDADLRPNPARFDADTALKEALAAGSHAQVLKALEALLEKTRFPDDRLNIRLQQGMQLRHLGRAVEATRVHQEALEEAREALGGAAVERMEVELYNSRLDLFEGLDELVAFFAERTARPFSMKDAELYAGGIYSRALAMAGRFDEALRQRQRILPLHRSSGSLAAEAGQSYAELVKLHALSAQREGLEEAIQELQGATQESRHPSAQRRYNLAALLRAALAFDQGPEAVAWVHGEGVLFGVEPLAEAAFLGAAREIEGHPQVTIARTYARLLRREGSAAEAVELLGRLRDDTELVGWLVEVGRLERALAREALGEPAAQQARADAFTRMVALHAGATRRYFPDADATPSELERAIDAIWY